MARRKTIVVDLETTNLDWTIAGVLEVGAVNLETGETLAFAPYVFPHALATADPESFAVNRYFERRVFERALDKPGTADAYGKLAEWLDGATLAGSNPRYDAYCLSTAFTAFDYGLPREPWHHRLADLAAYTAGALGIAPGELPGLAECCSLLGVPYDTAQAHGALYDATVTADCFRKLAKTAGERYAAHYSNA
ncbi:3'-5' exonuclease [Rhodococcus sp. PD04]|uniref:3'-5' exonuclease n=1 Tax=Rhodococcus sp. PD04 TaxID=3109594 RepID=UPI002DD8CC89|nr:exonuclease domain-containing protein [Rhodococcus sp. PD04]WSE22348.1 exonuclease domain-containing protein [Rhodococcus sp. PD04]